MKKLIKKKKKFSQKEKFTVIALLLVIGFSWTVIGVKAATTWGPSPSSGILLVTGSTDVTGTTADTEALGNNPGAPSCCGTAAKTYSFASASFGKDTFCRPPAIRTSIPQNVLFPASGGTTTWRCQCNNTNNIMGTSIAGEKTFYSSCSAKREGPGKCGPDNAKTIFVDKMLSNDTALNTDATISKFFSSFKLCATGVAGLGTIGWESYGNDASDNTNGCILASIRCNPGSINCWFRICNSKQKYYWNGRTIGYIARFCGDGILDEDAGEECDKWVKSLNNVGPREFGLPSPIATNNNPFYSHMFGHRCADKGLCGTAKCTDKCKVDYSGCYPCPPTKGGSGEIIK